MTRHWKTIVHVAGVERLGACYKIYNLLETKDIIKRVRENENTIGLPHRTLNPVARYLLDELIANYFEEHAPKGGILEQIIIEDSKVDQA